MDYNLEGLIEHCFSCGRFEDEVKLLFRLITKDKEITLCSDCVKHYVDWSLEELKKSS